MTFGEQIPITSPNSNTKSGFSKKSMRLVYRGKSNGSLGQRLLNLYKWINFILFYEQTIKYEAQASSTEPISWSLV